MTYENGRVPRELLVEIDGALFFPGTAVKYQRLIDIGARRGVRYRVSGPDDAYRLYDVQVEYKRIYGGNAAAPGYSSHGGFFEGAETGAVDVGNWGLVGQAAFYADAREAGFDPGYFDWEPWHIIDRTPWDVPAGKVPTTTSEEDDMKIIEWAANGACWLMHDQSVKYIQTPGELANLETLFAPRKVVQNDGLTDMVNACKVPWAVMEATYRGQAFDNESRFGRGVIWTREMAEAQRGAASDAHLAKSITDLQKVIDKATTAA